MYVPYRGYHRNITGAVRGLRDAGLADARGSVPRQPNHSAVRRVHPLIQTFLYIFLTI